MHARFYVGVFCGAAIGTGITGAVAVHEKMISLAAPGIMFVVLYTGSLIIRNWDWGGE